MIDIAHDPGEGVAYVRISSADLSGSSKAFEGKFGTVMVDFDTEGNPVGVEVIA